jgi:transketolase
VDRNRLQQGAGTEETNGLDPLDKKFEAFNWDVQMIDGHDYSALLAALSAAPGDRPRAIIANTVKGKGVSFMENKASWHHGVPNAEQFATAMKELV